ncbi:hypothetical protein A33Q_2071 [Indibacter alkaliphilus LW1]|uniref:L,D-transpeptidase catalytic domain n=2 Tax=Indibacter TaxID=647744 RepID=S2DXD2_INDAL|nr:hypothetical protein A33Q_2071 [Indibacter alkaliphilus LW1]
MELNLPNLNLTQMRFTLVITLICLILLPGKLFPERTTESDFSDSRDDLSVLIYQNGNNKNVPLPASELIQKALVGQSALVRQKALEPDRPLTIIDFSLPSTEKRLWVINTKTGLILFHDYVSHGRNSGDLYAKSFSNTNSSYKSSLGFYLTAETYHGKHGYSLRLDGLEKGINDKARERAIVIHGADYAKEEFIVQTGRLGRSLGCPALPNESASELIDIIKENSCIFIYAEDPEYFSNSSFF